VLAFAVGCGRDVTFVDPRAATEPADSTIADSTVVVRGTLDFTLVVGAGLTFGAQTAMAGEDACNPLPPEYGGPTCTASGCDACCQDNNQLPGTCGLWDACICG
jgi:hypothetical protein